MIRGLKQARKITLIVEGIVAASLVGLLILEMQVSNGPAPGSLALFAATRAPGDGGKTVTVDSLNKSTEQEIDKVIAKLMSDGQMAGVELSVQKKGKTVYEAGYGAIAKSGPRSKVVPAPNTRFQIDSLTKTFTAIAVLRLVEQGKIELNQPMGKYVGLPNGNWTKIPVRSYLGMITGIPDASATNGTYQSVIASTAVKTTKYGIGLDFEPGSKFLYSDVNYFILGELVGTVSPPGPQHGFMPYTKANVLEPFGMMDTGFIPFGNGDLWPTPYNDGNPVAPRKPDAGFSGGGFVSTMSDLEKYAIGLYNHSVLSSKSYKEMWSRTVLTSGTNKGNSINFGLGWDDVDLDSNGNIVRVSKNGGGWGWGSQLTIFPQAGDSVILLRNSNGGGNLSLASIDIGTAVSDKGAKPAISVNNVPNTCGGKLYVSGNGFLPSEHVSITVKNAPGSKAPQKLDSVGIADSSGNVTMQIPYSGNPYSGLPGCAFSSTSTVAVTITVTGEFSGEASTEFYMRNCAITWTACPA